jgi:hypothetical protein
MSFGSLSKLLVGIANIFLVPLLIAQPNEIPRTEHGHPDLQGTYTFQTITPLNRPAELENLEVLTPEQAKEWAAKESRRQNRDLIDDAAGGAIYQAGGVGSYNNFWYERGHQTIEDRRTSLIYDPPNGRIPAVNSMGQKRRAEYDQMVQESAGPEAFPLDTRCLTGFNSGPPMIPGGYNNYVQLVQTKDAVVIINEMVHTARIVRLDSEHDVRQLNWEGDSRGHWEGDTLIVHTQNFYHDHDARLGMSDKAQIIERFTRVDADSLEYDFTVEDPLSWDQPWSARFPLHSIDEPMYEFACHEGNRGLVGIMAGSRRYEVMGLNSDGTPKANATDSDIGEN